MNKIEILDRIEENKATAWDLIAFYMVIDRHYMYKEDFKHWDRDRYFTETPENDVVVLDNMLIDTLDFKVNKVKAVIYVSDTDSKYIVDININFDKQLYDQELDLYREEDEPIYIGSYMGIEIIKTMPFEG